MFELPEAEFQPHKFSGLRRPLWTEHKARLISRYLYYFVLITRHGVYIDGFAGPQNSDQHEAWAARLVLESEPKWMRNFFLCDIDAKQYEALEQLRAEQPDIKYRTIEVARADFNLYVDEVLSTELIKENTATFCLLDQRAMECDWSTVQKLAARKSTHKIEIFYFLPTGWLARSISGLTDAEVRMKRFWNRDDWARLQHATHHETTDIFCDRFRSEFNYKYAHAWPIYEQQGSQRVMYHMIHATDHHEAPKLMARAYRSATGRPEPAEQFRMEFDAWVGEHGQTIEDGEAPDDP